MAMTEDPQASAPPASGAGRGGAARPLFWGTVVVLVAADLWSKAASFAFLEAEGTRNAYGHLEHVIFDPWFRLARLENTGTVWGLFKDGTSVLIVLRCVMVVALVVIASRVARDAFWKLLGLAFVLGGALGNLYDNLFQDNRAVRDFIDVHIPLPFMEDLYHFPTFNIADSAIMVGAFTLFFAFGSEPAQPARRAPDPAPPHEAS